MQASFTALKITVRLAVPRVNSRVIQDMKKPSYCPRSAPSREGELLHSNKAHNLGTTFLYESSNQQPTLVPRDIYKLQAKVSSRPVLGVAGQRNAVRVHANYQGNAKRNT